MFAFPPNSVSDTTDMHMYATNKQFELIIFDLDGTLINTMGGFADIAGELIARNYGWSFERGRKRYLETSGVPFFQQLEILFPNNASNASVAASFEARKVASFREEAMPNGTMETLQRLRDRGYRTAISSNNSSSLVREFVQRHNVQVDISLGFRPGFAKGHAHFDYLSKYFGVPGAQMLFIGDSLTDARIARECGITFVGKTGTFDKTDFRTVENGQIIPVIHNIYELITLLEETCKQSYWPPEQAAA